MNLKHYVRYRGVMHEPESEPSDSGGEPGGAGPPENADPRRTQL